MFSYELVTRILPSKNCTVRLLYEVENTLTTYIDYRSIKNILEIVDRNIPQRQSNQKKAKNFSSDKRL